MLARPTRLPLTKGTQASVRSSPMMACSLLLASCAMTSTSSSLSASQAAQINKAGNLLAKHTTVTYAQLDFIGGNTTHITFFKNDAGEATYVEDDNGYAAYCTDLFGFVREKGESAYHIDCGGDTSVSGYLLMRALLDRDARVEFTIRFAETADLFRKYQYFYLDKPSGKVLMTEYDDTEQVLMQRREVNLAKAETQRIRDVMHTKMAG